jgi:hypothetical protein
MTSTKSFSTKNAGVLVVAIFSLAMSIGFSQVTTAMALDETLNCEDVANESNNYDTTNEVSCDENVDKVSKNSEVKSENDDATSTNDDDEADESDVVESKTNSVFTAGPAVASPDDNIIKPINLNKGTESDEPLETNNDKIKQSAESSPKQIFEDKFNLSDNIDTNTNTGISELYESFDLPYTAIYKNQ